MLSTDELWLIEDLLEDPVDLRALPDVPRVAPEREEDDLGMRKLLEHPEALSKAMWRARAA